MDAHFRHCALKLKNEDRVPIADFAPAAVGISKSHGFTEIARKFHDTHEVTSTGPRGRRLHAGVWSDLIIRLHHSVVPNDCLV